MIRARPTNRRLGAATGATTIALCGALAASASAGAGSTATQPTSLVTPGGAGATAKCPSGTKATGGGFQVTGGYKPPPTPTGTRSFTQVTKPSGKRSWHIATPSFGSAPATTLTAFARCQPGIRSVSVVTDSAKVDPTVATRLQPRCPPTRRLVGGGYSVTPTFHFTPLPAAGPLVVALESRKFGSRDWRVTVANVNLTPNVTTGKVTAYALCATGSAESKTVSKTIPITYGARADTVARCPTRWHTVSGGFKASPSFDGPTPTDYVLPLFDSSAPQGSRAWALGGFYYTPFQGNVADGEITAYAYCEHN